MQELQHTGAIGRGFFYRIVSAFSLYGFCSASEPLTPLCGSVVFVMVH